MDKNNQELDNKQVANKDNIDKLLPYFSKKLLAFLNIVKNKPLVSLACLGCMLILIFYSFSENKVATLSNPQEERQSRNEISGVERAVDPRARWTEEILSEVKNMKNQLENLIETKDLETKTRIDNFNQKLELLENNLNEQIPLEDINNFNTGDHIRDLSNTKKEEITTSPPAKRLLIHVKRAGSALKKDVKDYITTGSFARGVLLTGAVVGTGTNNAAAPEPIMLRLVDTAIFSKGYKTKQIKEAILIGSCAGDISSERAKCRLETLSLLNRNGEIIEKPVEGWLIGEDGRPGIKGIIVDRSSEVARMAALNGVLSGIAQFFQNQATNKVFPISPITGQQNALGAKDSLKAGVYGGTGNALEKLADFAIKRAESMSPVIVISSGRVIDVVFRKGVDLRYEKESQRVDRLLPPTTTDYSQNRTNYSNYQNYSSDAHKITNFSQTRSKLQQHFIKDEDDLSNQLDQTSPQQDGF